MPRFRRSRRRFGRRRRGPAKRARRIVRMGQQMRKLEIAEVTGVNLRNGDGTTRELAIHNIPSNLIQGDAEDQFTGNTVWLKGVAINMAVSVTTSSFHSFYVVFTLFFSRQNATGMTGPGTTYLSTTTDSANPTQATEFRNPRFFAYNTIPLAFVGGTMASAVDTTKCKVIARKKIKVNPGGCSDGLTHKSFFMRIGRYFTFQNPDESPLTTAPNHGKNGSYYLTIQTFGPVATSAGNASSDVVGEMDKTIRLYFKTV